MHNHNRGNPLGEGGEHPLQAKRWLADRSVVVVADSSFAALELIAAVRDHVCSITRLRLDANLFEPAPERRPGQRGRPRSKGKPLPKLSAAPTDRKTVWTRVTMAEWYRGQTRELDYVSGVAVWYASGLPPATIRWILVRDPTGEREARAFLCTNTNRERRGDPRPLRVALVDRDHGESKLKIALTNFVGNGGG